MSASEWLNDFLTNSTELSTQKEFVEFCERMERKYNIPKRITQNILNKKSSTYDQFVIFCMIKEIRQRMIGKLFTEDEIEKFSGKKYKSGAGLYNIVLVTEKEITEREKVESCFQNCNNVIIEENYIWFKIKADNENEIEDAIKSIKQNAGHIDWIDGYFICREENTSESAIKNYIKDMKAR